MNLLEIFHVHLPYALANAPFAQAAADSYKVVRTGAILNVPAVAVVAVLASICYIGIRQSSAFNSIIVAIKVAIVLMFIFLGVGYIQPHNWHPFIPPNAGHWGVYGISGIFAAAGVIFFAYIGFDAISTTAQEARNPQRDMPIGILASLVICTILYVVVSVILTGMVSYTKLDVPAPIALALTTYEPRRWLSAVVDIGAIAGMTSVMLVMTLAQARIFLAMSQDGLLPKLFGRVHPTFRTPSFGTVVTGIFAAIIGGLFPVGILGQMVSIGTLAAFVTVCIGVLVLRYKRPDLPRPFKAPWPWFTCLAGAVICLAMMIFLGLGTWLRLIVWTIVGALVYALYGHRHSKVRSRDTAPAFDSRAGDQPRSS
jgi:APA family basic amino acid/polyamine antiporter